MNKYLIFDTLIETKNRTPFDATKVLLEKLNIHAAPIKGTKNDVGYDSSYLNKEAYEQTFTDALNKAEGSTIIALENSSYLGLLKAKEKNHTDVKVMLAIDLISDALKDIDVSSKVKHSFNNFNAGIHYGSDNVDQSTLSTLLGLVQAKEVKLNRAYKDCGYSTLRANKQTAYKMAGNIMLDAFDTACDFVVVNDIRSFEMFDTNQKKLSCEVGREIGLAGLPVFSIAQIILMAMGEKEKAQISSNLVKPTFL